MVCVFSEADVVPVTDIVASDGDTETVTGGDLVSEDVLVAEEVGIPVEMYEIEGECVAVTVDEYVADVDGVSDGVTERELEDTIVFTAVAEYVGLVLEDGVDDLDDDNVTVYEGEGA